MGKGAVVLELNSSHVTLLTDEGAFVRMAATRLSSARYVGQHVDMDAAKSYSYGRWVSVAAACLVFLLIIPLFQPTPVQAWVTLDGTSSLEVLVDSGFRIIEIRPLNAGARLFMADIDSDKVSFSALVSGYLAWSSLEGDTTVLVTSTAAMKGFDQFFREQASDLNIILIGLDPLARDEAKKIGISAGRALFLAAADTQGLTISVDQIKEDNPFTTLNMAGADLDAALTGSSDVKTQVEKIKQLPTKKDNPGDTAGNLEPPVKPGSDKDASDPDLKAGDKGPQGNTPPGQSEPKTPPGQSEPKTPPGQTDKPQDEAKTPPGQTDKPQDEAKTPPGQTDRPQDENKTPPGQTDRPQDENKTPLGQTDKPQDEAKTPPGQTDKPQDEAKTPPGLQDKDKTPPGLRERLLPIVNNPAPTWREEKSGPPFTPPGQKKKK